MYATPVIYPLSQITYKGLKSLIMLNPVTMPLETLRWTILGVGSVDFRYFLYSWLVTIIVALGAVMIFNKVERTFMDTV
jgi:lipopolysaccharide transport system permease protein